MEAVLFCGIPASGKTTFFKEHFFKTHVRISLDLLKTRNRETQFLHTCLSAQQAFVVDNTNSTLQGRARYIAAAKAEGFRVKGYYFSSKLEEALSRNGRRAGKERIPEIGIRGIFNKLQIPVSEEGFDELYHVEIATPTFNVKEWKHEI